MDDHDGTGVESIVMLRFLAKSLDLA